MKNNQVRESRTEIVELSKFKKANFQAKKFRSNEFWTLNTCSNLELSFQLLF